MDEQVQKLRYTFKVVKVCEMCGDPVEGHKIVGQRLNKSQGMKPRSKLGISVTVMRCKNCGLIYSTPQPIPHSIQDHYGIPPESYWSSDYFRHDENYYVREIAEAKALLNFKPGMRSLDIGSGIGKGIMALGRAGFDAYGLEPSETFYRKSIEMNKISPDKLLLSSIEDARYEENQFDFISLNAVAEHLYTPAESIAKMVKWLKPEGVLCIEAPSADYLVTGIIDKYFKMLGTTYTSHLSPMHEPFHLFEFTLKAFSENSKRGGYTIVSHRYNVCNIPFFPGFLHPALKKYMDMSDTGMDICVWIKKAG